MKLRQKNVLILLESRLEAGMFLRASNWLIFRHERGQFCLALASFKPNFVSEGDLFRITVPLSISGLVPWIFILFIYFLATTSLLEHMPAKLPITLEDWPLTNWLNVFNKIDSMLPCLFSVTQKGATRVVSLVFLPHFDVFCDQITEQTHGNIESICSIQ